LLRSEGRGGGFLLRGGKKGVRGVGGFGKRGFANAVFTGKGGKESD